MVESSARPRAGDSASAFGGRPGLSCLANVDARRGPSPGSVSAFLSLSLPLSSASKGASAWVRGWAEGAGSWLFVLAVVADGDGGDGDGDGADEPAPAAGAEEDWPRIATVGGSLSPFPG